MLTRGSGAENTGTGRRPVPGVSTFSGGMDGFVGRPPWAAAGPLAGSGVNGKLESSCAFQDDCSVSSCRRGLPRWRPAPERPSSPWTGCSTTLEPVPGTGDSRRSPPSSSTLSGSARISLGGHPYLEENSIRVGLAEEAERYSWARCLAGEAGRGAGCGPGGPPHRCQTDSLKTYKLQGQASGLSYAGKKWRINQ